MLHYHPWAVLLEYNPNFLQRHPGKLLARMLLSHLMYQPNHVSPCCDCGMRKAGLTSVEMATAAVLSSTLCPGSWAAEPALQQPAIHAMHVGPLENLLTVFTHGFPLFSLQKCILLLYDKFACRHSCQPGFILSRKAAFLESFGHKYQGSATIQQPD